MITMKAKAIMLFVGLLFVALAHAYAVAQPSPASLVEAWERIQRNDSETVVFEKLGERRYRFKTERFPFDGELKILKASVDDSMADYDFGFVTGVIEFDLIGLSDEVVKKYEHSYAAWEQTNTLYLDKEKQTWLSSDEHMARLRAKVKATSREQEQTETRGQTEWRSQAPSSWVSLSVTWLPIVFIVGVWLWIMKGLGLRRQREYMNRAARHMETVEDLLERIARAVEVSAKAKE